MRHNAPNSVSPLVAGFFAAAIFMAGAGAYEIGRTGVSPLPKNADAAVESVSLPDTGLTSGEGNSSRLEPAIAAAPPAIDTRPLVILVIDDAGIDPERTQRLIDLPVAMTFSFLPYAEETPALARAAAARGHDVFLHLPMEPVGLEDPGPGALIRHLPANQMARRVETALARVPGATGLNNHMGSAFTSDAEALRAAFAPLVGRDLVFLDSLTSSRSRAAEIAREAGLETLRRDLFIDHVPGAEGAALMALQAMAHERGAVIAIAHPRTGTIDALSHWLNGPARDALRFVTIGEYLDIIRNDPLLASNEAVSLLGGPE
ncbi:divergent polysaccharide deacetylase family protein [Hyphobacterium sp.]|uniref:divergent polysaccharide deacetylase family protein n=1 Tax=Hyphobacterium sp. TaxID=2004662 RepID=UPI003BAD019B